jgi:hypothetical protein
MDGKLPRVMILNTPKHLWGIAISAAEASDNFSSKHTTMYYFNNTIKAVVIKNKHGCSVRVVENE